MKMEGALSNEVGLIVLGVLDTFVEGMHEELAQGMGDNYIMAKVHTHMLDKMYVHKIMNMCLCVPMGLFTEIHFLQRFTI